mmetsp:Transcript_4046/g.15605  ORF Transcript_4046/g.15605 Transcript_4046/m.15605 type:complete len:248 (+) Transcript_4046:2263-3006(+)
MKRRTLVSESSLTGAQLPEVLPALGRDVAANLHSDSPRGFAADGDVKIALELISVLHLESVQAHELDIKVQRLPGQRVIGVQRHLTVRHLDDLRRHALSDHQLFANFDEIFTHRVHDVLLRHSEDIFRSHLPVRIRGRAFDRLALTDSQSEDALVEPRDHHPAADGEFNRFVSFSRAVERRAVLERADVVNRDGIALLHRLIRSARGDGETTTRRGDGLATEGWSAARGRGAGVRAHGVHHRGSHGF